MFKVRTALIAVLGCLVLGAVAVPTAGAANGSAHPPKVTQLPPLYTVHGVTGKAANGKHFKGTYGIQRVIVRNGKPYTYGTLKGRLGGHKVVRYGVKMPVQLTGSSGAAASQTTCNVLHLVLGPINLNLLGLRVTLGGGAQMNQPIVLDITAVQGGGLLGDLLCGLTNALNQNGILAQLTGQVQSLTATLNSLLALLGGI